MINVNFEYGVHESLPERGWACWVEFSADPNQPEHDVFLDVDREKEPCDWTINHDESSVPREWTHGRHMPFEVLRTVEQEYARFQEAREELSYVASIAPFNVPREEL